MIAYTPGGLVASTRFRYSMGSNPAAGGAAGSQDWRYDYDDLARLTAATFVPSTGSSTAYSVSGIGYDASGNILGLTRRGVDAQGAERVMDALSYQYTPGAGQYTPGGGSAHYGR